MTLDYGETDRARREDKEFFQRWPDREYRLRRAWHCEISGSERPAGFEAFAIVHRQDQDPEMLFGAPITLETKRTDAEIKQMLAALAQDPRAMLNAK